MRSIFTYRVNRAEADRVVGEVAGLGGRSIALPLDTSDTGSFAAFAESVREALSELGADRFDYLVNNAGTSHHNSIEQTTEEELDALYHVHFKGVFFLTQKLLPLIRDGGRIVNLSSGLSRIIVPGSAPMVR